jgi:hypothetical protein
MYFPFLRGKQFEIIALRELAYQLSESKRIIPIIEPVKETSSYKKTFQEFQEYEIEYCFIINPKVPKNNMTPEQTFDYFEKFNQKGYPIYTFIIDNSTNISNLINFIEKKIQDKDIAFIYKELPNDYANISTILKEYTAKYNIVNEDYPKRYNRIIRAHYKNTENNLTILADRFPKKEKNSDYPNKPVFFSDDHLFYKEENYIGFSDYLTIGEGYTEMGFAPHAVTFHLTFLQEDEIWIKHFVSETIDNDPSNVAQKSSESLEKAKEFIESKNINTNAATEIIQLAEEGRFPGLGYLKKLSIKHHIELVKKILD